MSNHARKHWRPEQAPGAGDTPRPALAMPSGRADSVVRLKALPEHTLAAVWRGLYLVDRDTYDQLRGVYRTEDPLLAELTEVFDASPTIPMSLYKKALAAGTPCAPKN